MFVHLPQLDDPWSRTTGGGRLEAVERAAPKLRDAIGASGTVLAVRTFDVATFPYPTRYAFFGACKRRLKYVWMTNRALLIEFTDSEGERRRLLANPTSPEGSRKAPYFQDLQRYLPRMFEPLMSRQHPALPEQLTAAGVPPESIDYITFDHLHVQEIGPMLGRDGFYPNARLLVTPTEREAIATLHPLQQYWYVASGMDGVRDSDVIEFDRDVLLGAGLALVRTPGHTEGNHSIVFSLPDGLITVSENGVCVDAYAPAHSEIPGLREFAKRTGAQAIMNANSRERTLDQYTSMRLEAILGMPADGPWPRHFSSSELTPFRFAPGLKPTFSIENVSHGTLAGAAAAPSDVASE